MTMTPKEARGLWVAALRSGEFEQVRGALDVDDGYCCLGVACKLFQQHFGTLTIAQASHNVRTYDGCKTTLPEPVRRWLGLASDIGAFLDGNVSPVYRSLAELNDAGISFDMIATAIELEPDGLCE